MSRNILPEDFASQQALLTNVFNKHTADGPTSVLIPFLTQQKIDLSKAITAGTVAAVHEESRKLLTGTSQTQRSLRDIVFIPVFTEFQAWVQFLKKLYKTNPKELTAWGITIDTNGKITYPSAFEDRAKLFMGFAAKYNSYPADTSPLQPYITANDIEMFKIINAAEKAITANKLFENNATNATLETSLRDAIWQPIFINVKAIAAYLMSLFSSNPKKVTAWGFDIVDATAKQQLRATTLRLGEQITITSVVVGSTLTNTGKVVLHVYKGKTTAGTPNIVPANEQFGLAQGYSSTTVVNPSTLEPANFTMLVNK